MFRHDVLVAGNAPFPMAMLTIDGLYPASKEDASKIAAMVRGDVDVATEDAPICLERDSREPWFPSQHWSDYGWVVVGHEQNRM